MKKSYVQKLVSFFSKKKSYGEAFLYIFTNYLEYIILLEIFWPKIKDVIWLELKALTLQSFLFLVLQIHVMEFPHFEVVYKIFVKAFCRTSKATSFSSGAFPNHISISDLPPSLQKTLFHNLFEFSQFSYTSVYFVSQNRKKPPAILLFNLFGIVIYFLEGWLDGKGFRVLSNHVFYTPPPLKKWIPQFIRIPIVYILFFWIYHIFESFVIQIWESFWISFLE